MSQPNRKHRTESGHIVWECRSSAVCAHVYTRLPSGELGVLALKRGTAGDFNGLWCMPCGYLDWGETTQEAAQREAYEETQIQIGELQFSHFSDDPSDHKENITFHYRTLIQHCELPEQDASNHEVTEVKWMKLSEINQYQWAFHHDEVIQGDVGWLAKET